jgi:hypothetical protein
VVRDDVVQLAGDPGALTPGRVLQQGVGGSPGGCCVRDGVAAVPDAGTQQNGGGHQDQQQR